MLVLDNPKNVGKCLTRECCLMALMPYPEKVGTYDIELSSILRCRQKGMSSDMKKGMSSETYESSTCTRWPPLAFTPPAFSIFGKVNSNGVRSE